MTFEASQKLQRILDFFSVGTLKDWKEVGTIDIKVRDEEEPYTDPISGKPLLLPKTLTVELNMLWTTRGGYLLVSVSPAEEHRVLTNIKKPLEFLKRKLGLCNVSSAANFEDPKFVTCHMYDMYHYLFVL